MIRKMQQCGFLICLFFTLFNYVDAKTETANSVVATINVGVTPAGIALTPDNQYAYVANNGNYPGVLTQVNTVSVLNLSTNMLEDTIVDASFNEPYTVTINKAGTKAYVTNSNGSTITIIDIPTNTVSGTIGGFDGPSGMVITPNGQTAYVNNYGGPSGVGSGNGNTVSVVDLNSNTITRILAVGTGSPAAAPAALAITPDGAFVYVANYVNGNPGTGTISIINTADNSVAINAITGFSGPFAIAITPNGKYAYVTNFGSNNFTPFGTTVSVVDLETNAVVNTIDVGIQPSGIAIEPKGRYAYVANYNTLYAGSSSTNLTAGQGTVTIINLTDNTVLPPTIAVGQSPDAVAISSDGAYAYVTNYTSNSVSVINILERMWLK